eukprot:1773024-Amphidinium_carterae.1
MVASMEQQTLMEAMGHGTATAAVAETADSAYTGSTRTGLSKCGSTLREMLKCERNKEQLDVSSHQGERSEKQQEARGLYFNLAMLTSGAALV